MARPRGIHITGSNLNATKTAIMVNADDVTVADSVVSGGSLALHVAGGSNHLYSGNTFVGGVQIGEHPGPASLEQLIAAIRGIEDHEASERLIKALEKIAAPKDADEKSTGYSDFVASMANHVTVIGPFLSAIGL